MKTVSRLQYFLVDLCATLWGPLLYFICEHTCEYIISEIIKKKLDLQPKVCFKGSKENCIHSHQAEGNLSPCLKYTC